MFTVFQVCLTTVAKALFAVITSPVNSEHEQNVFQSTFSGHDGGQNALPLSLSTVFTHMQICMCKYVSGHYKTPLQHDL